MGLRDERMPKRFLRARLVLRMTLVFPSKAGTVLDQTNLSHYYFLPCLERAGLRRFRFHDLRHTLREPLI
jgi:integrase